MNTFTNQCLELLKDQVLSTAGFKTISPADCKVISFLIKSKTRQTISETTLKRIYGFALSKFKPSLFTLDSLSKFCDYNGWADFCDKQKNPTENTGGEEPDWLKLHQNANKITNFTLQALKNKSGIPYDQTIKRDFIDEHFNNFFNSEHTAAIFAAPAGYGKTIAMCHWIDAKISLNSAGKDNDIILFFSSNALMSVLLSGRDINDWMLALLGYSRDNDINTLFDIKQRKNSNFYLVIDGFDEHMFKSEQFKVLLNHIIDIFSFYQLHKWFKLVLSMRSATWVNNRHEFENNSDKWFTNFKPGDFCINVPLFSVQEIKELCRKINPSIQNFIALDIAENFNHPLYFQFYYSEHKENFTFNNVNHLSVYDLISTFICNKVYLGQNSTEKMLLIEKLVENMDIANGRHKVDKLKVNDLIKEYAYAYHELLSIGFLRELNESNRYLFNTYIEFSNNYFLDHSIARLLSYSNQEKFDSILIEKINRLFIDDSHKVAVLKWCIMQAIKTGQLREIDHLAEVHLGPIEKSELIIFFGELLDKEYSLIIKNDALIKHFKQGFSEKMFEFFWGLELIHPDYKKTLETLLKFNPTNRRKILIYSTLAITAIVKLDLEEINDYLMILKGFAPADYKYFAVNPLECIDSIYNYLKYGIIKKEALVSLTKLYFFPPKNTDLLTSKASNDLFFSLGMGTLLLCDNPKKIIRFINFLKKHYKNNLLEKHNSQYGFFVKIFLGIAYYNSGKGTELLAVYNLLDSAYNKKNNLLSPYMKSLFYDLKFKVLLYTNKENLIQNEMEDFYNTIEDSGSMISKVAFLRLILENVAFQSSSPDFYKQIKHDLDDTISKTGVYPKIFGYKYNYNRIGN